MVFSAIRFGPLLGKKKWIELTACSMLSVAETWKAWASISDCLAKATKVKGLTHTVSSRLIVSRVVYSSWT
jgi:hypothetical protein